MSSVFTHSTIGFESAHLWHMIFVAASKTWSLLLNSTRPVVVRLGLTLYKILHQHDQMQLQQLGSPNSNILLVQQLLPLTGLFQVLALKSVDFLLIISFEWHRCSVHTQICLVKLVVKSLQNCNVQHIF